MIGESSVVIGAGGGYTTVYTHTGSSGYTYDAVYNPIAYSFWNGEADTTTRFPMTARPSG